MKKLIKYIWIKAGGPKYLTLLKMRRMEGKKVEVDFNGNGRKLVKSDTPICVVIPVIEKDLKILPYTINSIRKNIKHNIKKIIIVAPKINTIEKMAKELKVEFVNEAEVLPIGKKDIKYIAAGIDRAGWLYQQLLKLGIEEWIETENYAVMDADTIITKPMVFMVNSKTIFDCSDENHAAYYNNYERLLGMERESKVSFVAHHMVINKNVLNELKELISQRYNAVWYKAIIDSVNKNEISGFSEYETYGNFYLKNYSSKMKLRYWNNYEVSLNEMKKNSIDEILENKRNKYLTVSFHSYNFTK